VSRSGQILALAAALSMTACGDGTQEQLSDSASKPAVTAASLGEQVVLETADYLQQEPYLGADLENGKRQALVCMACHSLQEDGPNMIGPALHGMFGRQVGQVRGFAYSPALQNADFIWTPTALDAWLAEPAKFLPGNFMTFIGVPKPQDRRDLIAYLLVQTHNSGQAQEN
tara:strand:- start:81 stop:593 length:513 start_codon:yes stop_codon:yes gene_type:complete